MNINKISGYFSTYTLTVGFFTALAGSAFIYLSAFGFTNVLLETVLALIFFTALLAGEKKMWFWCGIFVSILWFWWISLSMVYYGFAWSIPLVILLIAFVYASLFWLAAVLSEKSAKTAERLFSSRRFLFCSFSKLVSLSVKIFFLSIMSYIHPFGFDWFKPELVLVHTVFGIQKWQFVIVLISIALAICFRRSWMVFVMFLAIDGNATLVDTHDYFGDIELVSTSVPVEMKWNRAKLKEQIADIFFRIDRAIKRGKKLIVFPESAIPLFLNIETDLTDRLKSYSVDIDIVIGALYGSRNGNRNSVYFFSNKQMRIVDKVVLVPFGESNPLPDWASDLVNEIFFDGAPDYKPAETPGDLYIGGKSYRVAVCYEGTSEILYRDRPKRMILISNNGWFTPSIEPVLQSALLEYYNRKYSTEIYHSSNMSDSYTIRRVKIWEGWPTNPKSSEREKKSDGGGE